MRGIKLYIVLIFVLAVSITQAQNLTIKANIDTNHILIGDPVNFTLQITKPTGFQITFPELHDTITEKIEIIETDTLDTLSTSSNEITLMKKYVVSCYDSGQFAIPPLPFVYQQDTTTDTLYSQPLTLTCQTVPVDTAKKEIKDIKQPLNTPFSFQEFVKYYLPYILGGIIILLILYFAYKYYKKKRQEAKEKPKKVYVPKEAAHTIALRELESLKEKKLWQNDKIKQYYSELTDILRTYLENRYRISAMEQTTYEIISMMKQQNLTEQEQLNLLSYVLESGDLAKFAKYKPLPDENDKSLKNAFRFVEQTKLLEKPMEEKDNKTDSETSSPKE
ncbi:MAG: hypothetical protein DRP35_09655 [Candidatus Zixiibacteriota bacterium]|nr:MAG: hypothetical protein DRP35_09655 [candidate division Zixibacteria bacterium]